MKLGHDVCGDAPGLCNEAHTPRGPGEVDGMVCEGPSAKCTSSVRPACLACLA